MTSLPKLPLVLTRPSLWAAAVFLLNLTACPGPSPKTSASSQAVEQTLFVKGDPMALVEGARMNPTSPITETNASLWSHFAATEIVYFAEKEKVAPKKETNLQAENETKELKNDKAYPLEIQPSANGEWRLNLRGSDNEYFTLAKQGDGRLQPVSMSTSKTTYPLRALHWSVSKDGRSVSFLASVQQPGSGVSLMAIYFEKATSNPQHIPTTIPKYVYLAGPGKKVGWNTKPGQDFEVQLCGSPAYTALAKHGVEVWQASLKHRLALKFSVAESYGPFSDLNQRCIYFVNAYVNDQRGEVFNYGATWSTLSRTRAQITDGDIFIFNAEIDKVRQYVAAKHLDSAQANAVIEKDVPMAIAHEVGHLLGLGHQFDGTASIMSYDFKYAEPQAYDTQALEELYPLWLN